MIAPYWADVDTSEYGKIFYRQSTNATLLARAGNKIQAALSLTRPIEIKHLLIVTWDAVDYYGSSQYTVKVTTLSYIQYTNQNNDVCMCIIILLLMINA